MGREVLKRARDREKEDVQAVVRSEAGSPTAEHPKSSARGRCPSRTRRLVPVTSPCAQTAGASRRASGAASQTSRAARVSIASPSSSSVWRGGWAHVATGPPLGKEREAGGGPAGSHWLRAAAKPAG